MVKRARMVEAGSTSRPSYNHGAVEQMAILDADQTTVCALAACLAPTVCCSVLQVADGRDEIESTRSVATEVKFCSPTRRCVIFVSACTITDHTIYCYQSTRELTSNFTQQIYNSAPSRWTRICMQRGACNIYGIYLYLLIYVR
jgi:hypothetical protein